MGDIFREIDEELKQERYEKLWRLYGKYVIGSAVLIVLLVAGWKIWERDQTKTRLAEGVRFASAFESLNGDKQNSENAIGKFHDIGTNNNSGYGILAQFYEAAILAEASRVEESINVFEKISRNSSVPPSLQGLAKILGALNALRSPTIDPKEVIKRIEPMTIAGRPYRHVGLEILAFAELKLNNVEKAQAHYRAIIDDAEANAGIRGRAAQMLKIIGPNSQG